jgi:transposase
MTLAQSFIGIDIAQAWLDVFDSETAAARRIANDGPAIAHFVASLAGRPATVVFEATGSYDRKLAAALDEAHVAYVRVNPARARDFARAAGYLAKTDAIDARMLAAMGRALDLRRTEAVDATRTRLQALNKRRDQLVDARADDKKRRRQTHDPVALASIDRMLDWLQTEIAAIDTAIAELIDAAPHLQHDKALLQTAPGVGHVTAVTLLAGLPELGSRSPKAIAALAGLAPFNTDSGALRGRRSIKGGRRRIRRALYMAAISAIRNLPRFQKHYQAIAARSGSPKVAIIAIARKLLLALNAMLRTRQAFR